MKSVINPQNIERPDNTMAKRRLDGELKNCIRSCYAPNSVESSA